MIRLPHRSTLTVHLFPSTSLFRSARATRPLVLVFAVIAFAITVIFKADVDAQGGAYATGVLVLILSASIAVTLSAHRRGQRGKTIGRSKEHTSELQSLMRISYAVFCLTKKKTTTKKNGKTNK